MSPSLLTIALPMMLFAAGADSTHSSGQSGRAAYVICQTCHALDSDQAGPRHCNLFGRQAGSVDGFTYSDAMQNADIVWTNETLDEFLSDPQKAVPGTWMELPGIKDPARRAALIAHLARLNQSKACADIDGVKP